MIWLTKLLRKISTGANPGDKYLPALVRQPNMTKEELEGRIAARSSLTEGDVANCFKNFGYEIVEAVSSGRSIETEIGIFQVRLESVASDTLEQVTTDNVKKVNVRFLLASRYRRSLAKSALKFAFVDVTPKGHQEVSEGSEGVEQP